MEDFYMIKVPFSIAILIEIALIFSWIEGSLTDYGKIVLLIDTVCLLFPFREHILSLLEILLDPLLTPLHKRKKKKEQEKESGTDVGNHILRVQDYNAELLLRACSLEWLYIHVYTPISVRAETNFYSALKMYNDEFEKPMDKLAILRFIKYYHKRISDAYPEYIASELANDIEIHIIKKTLNNIDIEKINNDLN